MFRELDLDGNVIGNAAGRELLEALHLRKEGAYFLMIRELRIVLEDVLSNFSLAKLPKAGLKVNCRRMNATLFRDIFKLGMSLH